MLEAYGVQGVECHSLDVIDLHNLIWSATIRRFGFVEVGIALLEEVCYGIFVQLCKDMLHLFTYIKMFCICLIVQSMLLFDLACLSHLIGLIKS